MAWLSDEEYIYRQDIKEKKAAGRGIYSKKNGSKSKKCTLPSDYMTRKEKMAMNGEVMTYNPNAWYTWEEFKKLPMEYRIKYVNSLLTRYDCGLSTISSVVFGKSKSCLRLYFTKHKQLEYINAPKKGSSVNYQKGEMVLKEAMKRDLWPNHEEIQNGSKSSSFEITLVGGGSSFNEKPIATDEPIPENMDKPTEDSTDVTSFSIVMSKLDMGIIEYVRNLFDGKKYVVNLEVKEIKE